MLSVIATEKGRRRETLGGDGVVCYRECGDGSTGICVCPSSSNCVH